MTTEQDAERVIEVARIALKGMQFSVDGAPPVIQIPTDVAIALIALAEDGVRYLECRKAARARGFDTVADLIQDNDSRYLAATVSEAKP